MTDKDEYPPLRIIIAIITTVIIVLVVILGAVLIENEQNNKLEAICLKTGNAAEDC